MNIYILEDDLMQQTRISDIIRLQWENIIKGADGGWCIGFRGCVFCTKT